MQRKPPPGSRALSGRLLLSAVATGLVFSGCATRVEPGEPVRTEDARHGSGLGGRVVAVPSTKQRLRFLALQEWTLWGGATWNLTTNTVERPAGAVVHREDEPDHAARVLHYWYAYKQDGFRVQDALYPDGSLVPWSGAFISFLMKTAGIGPDRFASSELHWDYIKAIHDAPSPSGFEALDAATEAPAVGDLICAPRGRTAEQVTSFAQLAGGESRGAYHCDVVVEIGDRTLGAIGGNVLDGVTWTSVGLLDGRRLQPTPQRPWLVILRNNVE
jgi:hypothetical protein